MIAREKGGSIVMMSSIASSRALNDHLLYCSTKGALDQMMRVFALELGKHQVNIFIKVAFNITVQVKHTKFAENVL